MEKILEQLRKEARGIANTTAHFMKLYSGRKLYSSKSLLAFIVRKMR